MGGMPHSTAGGGQRMLAAIVPQGQQAWFFKVIGSPQELEQHAEPFKSLIQSIRFEEDKPQWELPAGWQSNPGSGMRFATLDLDGDDGSLELSVTPLPIFGEMDEYVLSNVNRWRGQVGLAPVTQDTLPDESEELDVNGVKVVLVDLKPAGSESTEAPAQAAHTAGTGGGLQYTTPDGWMEGEKVVSRGGIMLRHEAAFSIDSEGQTAEVTVDRLPAMAGLKGNINRWRTQIGLAAMTDEEMKDGVSEVQIGGLPGNKVEFVGAEQAILGAIVPQGNTAWYFKLRGPTELVQGQKAAFQAFLDSVNF